MKTTHQDPEEATAKKTDGLMEHNVRDASIEIYKNKSTGKMGTFPAGGGFVPGWGEGIQETTQHHVLCS